MSTWLDDLRRTDPDLAADYAIVGDQGEANLRRMVRALEIMPFLNTAEDDRRLAAAKRILDSRKRGAH